MNIGGAEVDVARVIKILQSEPLVLSFLAGLNGRYIKSNLDKAKIKSNLIWVNGNTFMNTSLIDSITGHTTKLSDVGPLVTEKDQLRFKQEIKPYIKDSAVLLINGVLPDNIHQDYYLEIMETAKSMNTKLVISVRGELLRKALQRSPYGVYLRRGDLRELSIISEDINEIVQILYDKLIENHIHYIALDLGQQGAYLISKNKICFGEPTFKIEPKKKASQESAFLGAFTVGAERKYELEKILKMSVAASHATVMCEDKEILCNKSDVDYLSKKVKVKELMNSKKGWLKE